MEYVYSDYAVRGICLGLPLKEEINTYLRFIDTWLAPNGCNTLVLLIRYGYQFQSHPECAAPNALSKEDMLRIKETCQKNGIRLIPKMNLLGHQSDEAQTVIAPLLKAHPALDETPEAKTVFYCRSFCPSHPQTRAIIFDLMDELIQLFDADGFHIGCDEVFEIGKCKRCSATPTGEIFAEWINALWEHLSAQGVATYMWGDRLLSAEETGYGEWEASANGTHTAIDKISRNIILCDWHYDGRDAYPSVDIFAKHGFTMLAAPWRYRENTKKLLTYAASHGGKYFQGFLATTWEDPIGIARQLMDHIPSEEENINCVADNLCFLFGVSSD